MIFFCTYTIFYTIVVLAWGGNRDIKRPNSFVANRPHNGFKAFMKLHLTFHHTFASKSGITNVNTMEDRNSNATSYWLWSHCAPPRPTYPSGICQRRKEKNLIKIEWVCLKRQVPHLWVVKIFHQRLVDGRCQSYTNFKFAQRYCLLK